MSEINNNIKQLILQDRKTEAIEALIKEYSFSEDQANEFYNRYREANTKIIKPGIAGKLSKGCGCFTVLFIAIFVLALYTGITSLSNESIQVDATVVGYKVVEQVDADARVFNDYYPAVSYRVEGKDYVDTIMTTPWAERRYRIGDPIAINVNPAVPEFAALQQYTLGDVIGDAVVWLVLALFAYMGYRFLKGFSLKFAVPEKVRDAIANTKDGSTDTTSEASSTRQSSATSEGTTEMADANKKNSNPLILSAFGLAIVIAGIGYGIYTYNSSMHGDILIQGEKVVGEVTSEFFRRSNSSSNSRSSYSYTISYEYNGGFYDMNKETPMNDYAVGDKVELMVNPADPQDAAINTKGDIYNGSYFWSGVLLLFGGWLTKSGYQLWVKEGRPSLFK